MNISSTGYQRIQYSWWLLLVTYGLLLIVAGADKFFNYVTFWEKYVSQFVLNLLPVNVSTLIMSIGLFEIVLGILTFVPGFTRIAAYLIALWLIIIALNLLYFGIYNDIAVRDVVMAMGAITLGLLTDVKEELEKKS